MNKNQIKKICFFGIYDRDYPRNKVLIEGFQKNGVEISHCHVNPREIKGFKKYTSLIKEWKKLRGEKFDLVWVAFPGHTCVWLAKILCGAIPVVFDVFLSLHEANVYDRKVHKRMSFNALKDYFLDWHSIRLPNIVTLDTNEHIKVFTKKYGLNPQKAIRVFLSSALPITEVVSHEKNEKFVVHFHGSFIPLHGVEFVLKAAKIIEERDKDILFKLVGGGQQLNEMKEFAKSNNLTNVEFLGRLPEYGDVLKNLKNGDIALGTFGTPERMRWVIANKIFEAMAFGKPILSADTEAMGELFVNRENVLFCKVGDGEDLAEKIIELKRDDALRNKIGIGAQKVFREKLAPEKLVFNFLAELKQKI